MTAYFALGLTPAEALARASHPERHVSAGGDWGPRPWSRMTREGREDAIHEAERTLAELEKLGFTVTRE